MNEFEVESSSRLDRSTKLDFRKQKAAEWDGLTRDLHTDGRDVHPIC